VIKRETEVNRQPKVKEGKRPLNHPLPRLIANLEKEAKRTRTANT